ncbi:uncharacterized protein [Atheta coriaria]|uniref:uncharacterized protein n=1 Tax=Dalotia coriaria TaxID=877792 RepID=UPI0031F34835
MIINGLPKDDLSKNFEAKVRHLTNAPSLRDIRSCCQHGGGDDTFVLFSNPTVGILVLILIIIFILLLLGLIKGIMGLYCCPPVGMCGLGALIDLPRPLKEYQEEQLVDFPVKYDMIGWPVHPQTNKRTVRALSLRSEFCLNVIFFLTYPLIMLVTFLTTCCFAQVYDHEDTADAVFLKEHKIMLTECPSIMCRRDTIDMHEKCIKDMPKAYNGESGGEERDTHYVLEQMRKSEEKLQFS